jgi:hypothetical protein
MTDEKTLHRHVCEYLKYAYPGIIFNSDLSGSTKLTMGQAVALKKLRSGRGFPDLMILEPRGKHHGLFIEIKTEDTKLFKARTLNPDGSVAFTTDHIKEQAEMIQKLSDRGYFASFGIGFDDIKNIIDSYLKK